MAALTVAQAPPQISLFPSQAAPTASTRPDGRLFSLAQRLALKGSHPRRRTPEPGRRYVAGAALATSSASAGGSRLSGRPLTITVGELHGPGSVHIVHHERWMPGPGPSGPAGLAADLEVRWRCQVLALDERAFPGRAFDLGEMPLSPRRSVLASTLLRYADGGLLAMYADDGSAEHREFWAQVVRGRVERRAGYDLRFYVEPSTGDESLLVGLALVAHAAESAGRSLSPLAAEA